MSLDDSTDQPPEPMAPTPAGSHSVAAPAVAAPAPPNHGGDIPPVNGDGVGPFGESVPDSGPGRDSQTSNTSMIEWFRHLRRSSTDHYLGGVAGGIAESLGIPSILVRLAFILLGVTAVGVPLYLALWALVQRDDAGPEAESNSKRLLSMALLGVAAVIFYGMSGLRIRANLVIPLGLMLVGLAMLLRRPASSSGGASTGVDQPIGTQQSAQVTIPGGGDDTAQTLQTQPAAAQPRPARPPKPLAFPLVGLLTWSTVLVTLAVLGLLVNVGAFHMGPGAMVSLALVVFSAGLLVSAFWGKARGLILPILALVALLAPLAALNIRVDSVDSTFRKTFSDPSRLPDELRATAGSSTLNLTGLRLETDHKITVEQNFGDLYIALPTDTTVRVVGEVGLGNITLMRPDRMNAASAFPSERDLWLADGIPEPGSALTGEMLEWVGTDQGAVMSIPTRHDVVGVNRTARFTVDQGSANQLTIVVSMGIGTVKLVDPHWAKGEVSIVKPSQLCTVGGAPRGTVKPCGEVQPDQRVALCINEAAFLVDCREDRPATPDYPRVPACRGYWGEEVPCDEVGIVPIGAQLVSPDVGETGQPVDPSSPDDLNDTTTSVPTPTIAMPDSPDLVPDASTAPTSVVPGG